MLPLTRLDTMALGFVCCLSDYWCTLPFESAECELQPQKVLNLHHFNGERLVHYQLLVRSTIKKLYQTNHDVGLKH